MKNWILILCIAMPFLAWSQPAIQVNSQVLNVVELEPVNFYPPHAAPSALSSYRYFWYFDDGSFFIKDVDQAAGSDLPIKDTLPGIGSYLARLEMTYIYSPPDTDDLKAGFVTTALAVTGTGPAAPSNPVEMYGQPMRIHPVRVPVAGDSTVYILTYEVDPQTCPRPVIEFSYPDNVLSYVPARFQEFYGETITLPSAGQLKIELNQSGKNNLFLGFDVSKNAEAGGKAHFFANLVDDQVFCGEFYLEHLFVGKSYDPNTKQVSEDTLNLNPPQLLKYRIQFQNTGTAPTDSIRIQDLLDPRLDPTTVVVTAVRLGYQEIIFPENISNDQSVSMPATPGTGQTFTYTLNKSGSLLTWSLDSASIRGTKEGGYGFTFSETETIGQIEFEVMTYCFQDLGAVIENAADIYFDDNTPVRTDTARTYKVCCKQWVDPGTQLSFDPLAFVDSSRLMPPYVLDSLSLLSATSDKAPPSDRPQIKLDTLLTYFPGAYSGMDLLTFRVCDGNTPPLCDTFEVPVCVDIRPGTYPCDPTPCAALGIKDLAAPYAGLKVYPNPAKDQCFVDAREMKTPVTHLALYDLQGRRLRVLAADPSGLTQCSLAGLPEGLYFFRVNHQYMVKILLK